MSDITLRVIEGLILYDLFRIAVNLTLRLILGVVKGEDNAE